MSDGEESINTAACSGEIWTWEAMEQLRTLLSVMTHFPLFLQFMTPNLSHCPVSPSVFTLATVQAWTLSVNYPIFCSIWEKITSDSLISPAVFWKRLQQPKTSLARHCCLFPMAWGNLHPSGIRSGTPKRVELSVPFSKVDRLHRGLMNSPALPLTALSASAEIKLSDWRP